MEKSKTFQPLLVSGESLRELQNQCNKFEQSCHRLDARDRELLDMIKKALIRKDKTRATMYANELVRVRHMNQVFSKSQLALECITMRMESLLDLFNAIQIDPISEAIKDVVGDIQSISPEFTANLEKLNALVGDTLGQASIKINEPELEDSFNASSPESLAILKEVSQTIENSLQEAFPEPPLNSTPAKIGPQAEAVGYDGGMTFKPQNTSVKKAMDISELSDDVFDLIKKGQYERAKESGN